MTDVSTSRQLSVAKQALLAQRLRGRGAVATIRARAGGVAPPLSFAQERLWFMEQLVPGSAAHTIPVALRLRGALDAGALGLALGDVADRHEALRMCYPAGEDGRPEIRVREADGSRLPLRVRSAGSADAAQDLVGAAIAEPFDLATGPVARAALVRLADDDHVLALAVHHIACDGWSADILLADLFALYEARRGGRSAGLAQLPVQYGDYAIRQREGLSGAADGDFAYWKRRLAALPALDLVTDRPRPAEQTYGGAGHGFRLDRTLTRSVHDLARRRDATAYMVLLAGFQVLLGRYAAQDDFAVGSPVAGRPLPELEPLVGCFVNLLTMRADLTGRPSFAGLLGRVREAAADAYDHQELPFERLVQRLDPPRDVSRPPLFQVLFAMQNYQRGALRAVPAELAVEGFALESWATRFDLELYIAEDDAGMDGLFVYNTDLFDPATIARLATHFTALLTRLLADPDACVDDAEILGAAERAELITGFNDTAGEFPSEMTLHGLVEAQAARSPDAVAVTFEGARLTYRELNARADGVAHRLCGLGVGPETLVAVCAERSLELPVALLGVLKAGAAYVPLDPEYPADRLAFMLADAAAPVVLTQESLRGQLPPTSATVLVLDDLAGWPAAPPGWRAPAGDLAYAIYTSGSTGRPKGVLNTHRGIVNRLDWMQRRYRLGADDVVLQKTPASFDVSVWEFFWPLLAGARMVLARPGGHKDAAYLRDLIQAQGVTTAHFVPSMLGVFLAEEGAAEEDADHCRVLRRIICSGEELPADVAARCLQTLPAELHNLYGPTEAAIDVSAWQCTPDALAGRARVPIGGPIQNLRLYVLDPQLRAMPAGVPGELFLGGVGLARGYLRRPALTADRFVPDPFGPPGSRLYRTGDLSRWRPDGTVEFLGRIDGQVKIRGLRIELGEIEAALREQPGVADAAAVVREDVPGDRRIVAYVVGGADQAALRTALKRRLPDYMVPSAVTALDALPLLPNGKLDRRALPAPQRGRDETARYTAPRPGSQATVASVWAEVLQVERIGVDDDFFDLGGHSLLAAQVIAKLRKTAGPRVSVLDLFKNPTVRALAALLDIPAAERGPAELVHELTKPVPAGMQTLSLVCVPYGGGSAIVYQPLANALPAGYRLFAVAIPGHDIGLDEDALPFDELAGRCVAEVLAKVDGPIAVYGHCGVGSALAVEISRRLEAAGRRLEAVYIGAIFPFARPGSHVLGALSRIARMERLRSDQGYANWLVSMGVDMGDLEPERARHIVRNMRKDSQSAEDYYTGLLESGADRLDAPVITVAGERDPTTDFYQERYREWHFLTDTAAVFVLDEAGHFFLKYRADELAAIITGTPPALDQPEPLSRAARGEDAGWWLHGVSRSAARVVPTGPAPSMRRFLAVASGQLVSIIGSALTEFAVPLWIYLHTGSLFRFALFAVCGLVPGMLAAPLAGAVVDRSNRRRIMLLGDTAAGGTQLVLGILLWTGRLQIWEIYPLLVSLSVALTFQRLAYGSSVAQLVPKHYLGHANGVVQMIGGVAQIMVPLVAVGLMAAIGLGGILAIDVVSYAVAVGVVLFVRFPATMAWRRRETLLTEMAQGFRYSWGQPGFRAMLLFFAALNVFLAPLFLLISPLVLSFTGLTRVGEVALAAGVGATLGGLAMAFWGGPPRRRMRGMLLCTLALSAFCLVTGLRPSLWTIGAGAFGMALWLTLVNGIYTTIVQVKVAQRFHGRVFALNTLIAWSTLPIGWGLVVPYGARLFNPLMARGGALSGVFGPVVGVGPGRGIGLMYLLFAVAMALLVLIALRTPALARFDEQVPDAAPDDLIGFEARQRRAHDSGRTGAPRRPVGVASVDAGCVDVADLLHHCQLLALLRRYLPVFHRDRDGGVAAVTTTPRLLAARAAAEPDRTALIVDGVDSLTFGAWHARSSAAARAILRRGLPPGGRVGLLFDARGWVDYAVCFAAVHKAGGVAVPLPRTQPDAELARLLADCGASGVIHDGTAGYDGTTAAPSAGALPAGAWTVAAAELAGADPGPDPGPVDVEVGPADLAQILYTSGTTGRPKGVAATHANLTYGCGRRRRPFAHSRHLVHAFPIGTNAGQVMLLNALDAHPAVVSPARFTPARFARTIERYAAGTVFLVPAMAVELLNAPVVQEHDLSSVVLLGSAAAPLPGAVAARLAKAFPNATIANYYTSTEAAPAQTAMLYDPARPGSVGRAIDGGDVRVAAAGSGEPVAPGEVGEVWLRSRAVPRAYFGDAAASGEVFKAGWIRMGDLGRLDADGYLYLVDRGGDMVKSGAFKVSTLHVEEAIYEHPDIIEAAVVGVPHPVLGTVLAAVVVTRGTVPPERLRRFLLDRLAPHEVPARVVAAASLPRNAGGKVDKRALLGELT